MKSRGFSFELSLKCSPRYMPGILLKWGVDKLAQKIVKTNTSTISSFNLHDSFFNYTFVRSSYTLQRDQYNCCFGNQLLNLSLWAEGSFMFRRKSQVEVWGAENSTAVLGSLAGWKAATMDSVSAGSVQTLLHT